MPKLNELTPTPPVAEAIQVPDNLTVPQLAAWWQVSERCVRGMLADGRLKGVRIASAVRIRRADAEAAMRAW